MVRSGLLAWGLFAAVGCASAPPASGSGHSNDGAANDGAANDGGVRGAAPTPDPSATATVTAVGTAAAAATGAGEVPAPTLTATTSATAPGPALAIPAGAVGVVLAPGAICPPRFPQAPGSKDGAAVTSAEAAEKALGCAPSSFDFTRFRLYLVPLSGTNLSFTFTSNDIVREAKGIVLKPNIHSLCRGAAMLSQETFVVLLPAGTEPVTVAPTRVPLARPCLAP